MAGISLPERYHFFHFSAPVVHKHTHFIAFGKFILWIIILYWLWFYDLGLIFLYPTEACHEYVMNGAISVSLNLVAMCLLLVIVIYVSNGTVAMHIPCQCYCASHCIVLKMRTLQLLPKCRLSQVVSVSFGLEFFESINNKCQKLKRSFLYQKLFLMTLFRYR